MAGVLLQDIHDAPAPTRKTNSGQKLGLRAFAWRSSGERTPGQGADWRKCHGLGPYVRHLGMARLASGELGPTVYISRAAIDPAGLEAVVWETFYPPAGTTAQLGDRSLGAASWTIALRRDHATGPWRIVGRAQAPSHLANVAKR